MTGEDAGIRALWERMSRGWAAGSGADFASVFTEDVAFTSVRGDDEGGRAGVAARHDQLFASVYRQTTLSAEVHEVRHLAPGIALVHATGAIARPDGTVAATTDAQAVAVDRDGRWQIAAFHNMVPVVSGTDTSISPKEGTMSRPRIRHLAFTARDAEALARFYCDQFEMEVFHKDDEGNHFLTDGYINLAILQQALDGDVPTGFNHFGFQVDDVPATSQRLVASGGPEPAARYTKRPFAEYRAIDPEGNWFDLSGHGYLPTPAE